MIKVVFGFSLQAGKSLRGYRRHFAAWRAPAILGNPVAPAGLSLQWGVKPVQLWHGLPAVPLPYHGLTMNWFDSNAQLARYTETPLFDTLAQHGMQWLSRAHGYLVEEVVHWRHAGSAADGDKTPGLKLVLYLCRRSASAADGFEPYYRAEHAEWLRGHRADLVGYVQNFVRSPLLPDAPPVDVITEMHFLGRRQAHRLGHAMAADRTQRLTELWRFLDPGQVQGLTVEECVYRHPPC